MNRMIHHAAKQLAVALTLSSAFVASAIATPTDTTWIDGVAGPPPGTPGHAYTELDDASRKELTDIIGTYDPEAAAEIEAAAEGEQYNIYDMENDEQMGVTSSRFNSIGLERGLDNASAAAVLYHEWMHARAGEGRDGPP
jgi:hypothetical protein